ncbi:MAG: DUF4294 domain-containing protein [Paludibacter sp.]
MIYHHKYKSRFIAVIGTVFINLLLFGLLTLEFSDEQSSHLSNDELDALQLQMEDFSPEVSSFTPPGKNPLTQQKDKASESVSKEKGEIKSQQPTRTAAEIEEAALAIPETIAVPKPEVILVQKTDSDLQAKKDSAILTQVSKLQKVITRREINQQSQKDRDKYQYYFKNYKNIRNFRKAYPYALKTREIIEKLNIQLAAMTSESEKKALIKETEKILFKEYESAVRNMSTSQGRLLLKLIARETNRTGYQIIKDYKGAFPATFWYGVGKIFGTDLKSEFHKENEDSVIETIIDKYKSNDLY